MKSLRVVVVIGVLAVVAAVPVVGQDKILRTMDDGGAWNLLILREYTSLAGIETNVEKSDALLQQTDGSAQVQIKGYEDRSRYREVVGTKYARELILK